MTRVKYLPQRFNFPPLELDIPFHFTVVMVTIGVNISSSSGGELKRCGTHLTWVITMTYLCSLVPDQFSSTLNNSLNTRPAIPPMHASGTAIWCV